MMTSLSSQMVTGTIVEQFDLHVCAKDAGLHMKAALAQRLID